MESIMYFLVSSTGVCLDIILWF